MDIRDFFRNTDERRRDVWAIPPNNTYTLMLYEGEIPTKTFTLGLDNKEHRFQCRKEEIRFVVQKMEENGHDRLVMEVTRYRLHHAGPPTVSVAPRIVDYRSPWREPFARVYSEKRIQVLVIPNLLPGPPVPPSPPPPPPRRPSPSLQREEPPKKPRITLPSLIKLPEPVQNEPSSKPGQKQCDICMDRAACTVVRPCKHMSMCITCSITIGKVAGAKCPLCNTKIQEIEAVFV